MKTAYLNNKFIPLDKAGVSILDRGLLYGDGIFETMRSYEGAVFLLEKHIERMYGSLKNLGIHFKIKPAKIEKIVYALLDKNRLKEAYIKIIVTRGKTSGLLAPGRNKKPTFIIYAVPHKSLPANVYKKGITACVSEDIFNEQSKIAGQKTLNYLENILRRREADNKGFADIIFTNTEGFVSEASSSNIFWVKKSALFTPPLKSGCLPGIMRAEIMRLAKKVMKFNEKLVKKEALYKADEIFLTNSVAGIVPVIKVDKSRIGSGAPGAFTKEITGLMEESIENYRTGRGK